MPRLTREQWLEARVMYESSPKVSIAEVARTFGVDKKTIYKKIRNEGWRKSTIGDCKKPLPQSVEAFKEKVEDILSLHRDEWRKHRELFELSAIANNFELGKAAKISAEMLAIRQKAERQAWGLVDEAAREEAIVIERSYVADRSTESN